MNRSTDGSEVMNSDTSMNAPGNVAANVAVSSRIMADISTGFRIDGTRVTTAEESAEQEKCLYETERLWYYFLEKE